jgi:hypothetical protein
MFSYDLFKVNPFVGANFWGGSIITATKLAVDGSGSYLQEQLKIFISIIFLYTCWWWLIGNRTCTCSWFFFTTKIPWFYCLWHKGIKHLKIILRYLNRIQDIASGTPKGTHLCSSFIPECEVVRAWHEPLILVKGEDLFLIRLQGRLPYEAQEQLYLLQFWEVKVVQLFV